MTPYSDRLSIHITKHFSVNILFFPILAASILGRFFLLFSISFICALLHELAHVAVAIRLGVGVSNVQIQPFGVCAHLKSSIIKNPWHEIAVAICGPLTNFIICSVLSLFSHFYSDYQEIISYAFCCNLAMASINLLPCLPLDGGRIVRSFLTLIFGALPAYNFIVKLSRFVILLLICLSVYMLLTSSFNFSLILIVSFLLGNLYGEQRNISHRTMTELMNYKEKLCTDELNHSSVITAHKSTPARKILRKLSYNRYYIIHVTDDDMRILKTLSEGEIVGSIIEKGIRITLGDI